MRTGVSSYLRAKTVAVSIPFWDRCKLAVASGIVSLQNSLLYWFRKLLYKSNSAPGRILIFRTGSLGDSLCAIPSIKAIAKKFPNAQIDILTNAGRANLAGLHHLLEKDVYHELVDYYGYSKKALFNLLRKRQYDMVVQLSQVDATWYSLMRDLVIFRAVAPSGLGWHKSQIRLFRKTQARHLQFPNELQRLAALLNEHGIPPVMAETIIAPSRADLLYGKQVLQELGVPSFDRLIAIVVGAKRPQNRWPINYFKQVVTHFSTQYHIILIGAKEDNEQVQVLLNIENVFNACGRLTPVQSAAVMSLCRLTISNDTGPMHLSYAVGTPTIAIFSSRDLPGKWYPQEKNNRVIRADNIHCQACYSETCHNNICMQAITPAEVINCANSLLK